MENRETFLKKFNLSFVENDLNYIFDGVTDDVHWEMIGEPVVNGREALIAAMNNVKRPHNMSLEIESSLIDKDNAAVTGTMVMTDSDGVKKKYAFCDVYKFSPGEDNKIRELKAFIINID